MIFMDDLQNKPSLWGMKLILAWFLLAGLLYASVFAQENGSPSDHENADRPQNAADSSISSPVSALPDSAATFRLPDTIRYSLDRIVPNTAFQVGEKLTFKVRYGFIKAGEATMEVKDLVMVNDSIPTYYIISTARSAKAFDLFYKVRDRVETFVDTRGLFSWKFNKRLREGGYKFDLLVTYHQAHGIAEIKTIRYYNDEPLRVKNQEEFTLEIPQYVLDVLASFYYVRNQDLRVGEPIYITNHDNKKIYDLQVIIQRKERIKVSAGKFDCVVVSPRLKGEGIFQQKGELWIWLTDDERKIPVQMSSKVAVGSITTELTKIEGVPLPLKAQVE